MAPFPLPLAAVHDTSVARFGIALCDGRPTIFVAAGPSASCSLLLSSILLFSSFSSVDSAWQLERLVCSVPWGSTLNVAERHVSSRREIHVLGDGLANQSQLSSCVSGHRESLL